MQALVHDPDAPAMLRRTELPDPKPAPDEVVIAVAAASFNFLDLAYADDVHRIGAVPGEDAAGVVVAAASDGSGPAEGSRVSSFGMGGALAALRAVPTVDVGLVPAGVGLVAAAALAVGLVAAGRLDPQVGWRGPGERAGAAADALRGRRVAGKAVVEIGPVS